MSQMMGVVASGLVGPLQDSLQFNGLCTVVTAASVILAIAMLAVAQIWGSVEPAYDDLMPLATAAEDDRTALRTEEDHEVVIPGEEDNAPLTTHSSYP